jgi:hypothetical protein
MKLNIFIASTRDLIAERVDVKMMPNKLVIIDGTRYQVDKIIPVINTLKPTEEERLKREELGTEPDLIDLTVDANLYVRKDNTDQFEVMTHIDPMYNRNASKNSSQSAPPTKADVRYTAPF